MELLILQKFEISSGKIGRTANAKKEKLINNVGRYQIEKIFLKLMELISENLRMHFLNLLKI